MRIHFIQHVPFETPGFLGVWALHQADFITFSRPYETVWFPEPDQLDMIIVLGGPMSVNDTKRHPWLLNEMNFLEKAVKKRKKVLGICLGAQLLTRVLGGSVYQNPYKEIGWHPVRLAPAARNLPLFQEFPATWNVFHWHGETFAIPPMGYRIAESDACPNQGYLYEDHVLALQFHMESDVESVEALLKNCADELVLGSFIQTPEEIRTGMLLHSRNMHRLFGNWLHAWVRQNGNGAH
jgi:GMP synthase-like glutamine amidotransferase